MSETPPKKPKLFELPENGDILLPQFYDWEMEKVPRKVHEQIYHQKRIDEVTKPTLLRSPLAMDFGDSGRAFVMAYHQLISVEGHPSRNYAVYEVDMSTHGEAMGFGVSLLELDDNNRFRGEPPFVYLTLTKESFRRQGLAIRRLLILNEANKLLFNNHLVSGSFSPPHSGAEQAWQLLVAKGMAAQDEHGYQFIK